MMKVTDVQQRIIEACGPMGSEMVPIGDAYERIAAMPHVARVAHPPMDVSAMDGYAVRHEDCASVPASLTCRGASTAGDAPGQSIAAGHALRIFTGASVPAGADAIAIQENVTAHGEEITIHVPPVAGKFIRKAGQDFRVGDQGIGAGEVLKPQHIGLLAAMNHAEICVMRKPRVAILATGNELRAPGSDLQPGEIVSSNSHTLAGLVRRWGGVPVDLGTARDTVQSLLNAVENVEQIADILVVSGGASVGDHDLVRPVLTKAGLELNLWKIAMRPGKPLGFGHFRGLPFFSFPGNPVSSSVCAILFLRAAMKTMLGQSADLPFREALNGRDLPVNDEREDYLRAVLETTREGALKATAFGRQDSGMFANFARAGCLLRRNIHAEAIEAGAPVEILVLDELT